MAVFSTMSKKTDPNTFDPTSPLGAQPTSSSSANSLDDLGFSTPPHSSSNSFKDSSYTNNKHGEFTLANSPTRKK